MRRKERRGTLPPCQVLMGGKSTVVLSSASFRTSASSECSCGGSQVTERERLTFSSRSRRSDRTASHTVSLVTPSTHCTSTLSSPAHARNSSLMPASVTRVRPTDMRRNPVQLAASARIATSVTRVLRRCTPSTSSDSSSGQPAATAHRPSSVMLLQNASFSRRSCGHERDRRARSASASLPQLVRDTSRRSRQRAMPAMLSLVRRLS
mmetsp:Transcript_5137/g.18473  ORF Transcript_5137/g.18473 Transcript_5137/m.18473 type:complete len:208 (-) Transcript_5137:624-1247(-)